MGPIQSSLLGSLDIIMHKKKRCKQMCICLQTITLAMTIVMTFITNVDPKNNHREPWAPKIGF